MSGLEGRILTLFKELEEEKRLADKRAKQLYLAGASFIGHVDTPAAYAAQAGKFVKVNAVPDALIFASIAWGDVGKTGSNLTDLATRQHAGLTNITSDQHHPQAHTLASHSTKAHSELSDAPADAHHPQSHTLTSHSTRAHAELSDAPANAHHAQLHAAAHHVGGGDLVNHDSLTGFVAAEHKSLPNTIAQVLSNHTTAVHDALSINAHRVDGYHAAEASTVSTVVVRNSSGDIQVRLVRSEYDTTNPTCNIIYTAIDTASNNYLRPSTKAQLIASLNLMTKAGGAFTGLVTARDHGTASVDEVVNVCYGTGDPPAANTTTIGTIYIKYTA